MRADDSERLFRFCIESMGRGPRLLGRVGNDSEMAVIVEQIGSDTARLSPIWPLPGILRGLWYLRHGYAGPAAAPAIERANR